MTEPSKALLPFVERRLAGAKYHLGFRAPFHVWQKKARTALRAAIPPFGQAEVGDARSSAVGRHLNLRYSTGGEGEGVLLLPPGDGPHPAVMLMHDHGGEFSIGWQKMVSDLSGEAHVARHYGGRCLADWLCSQGYAVLVTDALGWGSRFAGGYDQQQALAAQIMQAGWSLAGVVAAEDAEALGWLAAQPEIDASRIAAFGYSFGGFRAFQLQAVTGALSATIALSWLGCRHLLLHSGGTLLRGQSAFYTLHPSLSDLMDYPDLAAIGLDQPMFVRVGDSDPHFPIEAVEPALATLRKAADQTGSLLDAKIIQGAHNCPRTVQEEALNFLQGL